MPTTSGAPERAQTRYAVRSATASSGRTRDVCLMASLSGETTTGQAATVAATERGELAKVNYPVTRGSLGEPPARDAAGATWRTIR